MSKSVTLNVYLKRHLLTLTIEITLSDLSVEEMDSNQNFKHKSAVKEQSELKSLHGKNSSTSMTLNVYLKRHLGSYLV